MHDTAALTVAHHTQTSRIIYASFTTSIEVVRFDATQKHAAAHSEKECPDSQIIPLLQIRICLTRRNLQSRRSFY